MVGAYFQQHTSLQMNFTEQYEQKMFNLSRQDSLIGLYFYLETLK